jgi:hypothetical protein
MACWNSVILSIISALTVLEITNCVELTFELEDNAKQCFYEEIKKNQTATLEYQVCWPSSDKVYNFPNIPSYDVLGQQKKIDAIFYA